MVPINQGEIDIILQKSITHFVLLDTKTRHAGREKMRFLTIILSCLLFLCGCSGGGGSSGGSGEFQPLDSSTINGNWSISEFYKDGSTKQWQASIVSGPRFAGGGASLTFKNDVLVIRNPYSYWVVDDLSNSREFTAYGPVSNLHFSRM